MATKSEKNEQSQFALSFYDHAPQILKKPVQAIHMGITGGIINKTQILAFNAMLKNAHNVHAADPDGNHEVYSISREYLMSLIDYTSHNRKHLKDTLKRMMDLKVEWDVLHQDGSNRWAACVLMPYVEFDENKIYYSYVSHMKPMLLNPETYSRLDLSIQRSLKLNSSVALYDWVNRFRDNPSKKTNEMNWEQWRWAIYGVVDNELSSLNEYKIFKRDKLNPAIAEINAKTDLKIKLIENKDGGRKVKFLQFIVEEVPLFDPANKSEKIQEDLDKKLADIGMTERDRKKIISKFSAEVIQSHYDLTMKRVADPSQAALKSVSAYFKNVIANGYANQIKVDLPKESKNENNNVMIEIEEQFRSSRNIVAAGLFNELSFEEREQLISDFNEQLEIKAASIPKQPEKRIKRLMAPFFAWFAQKTWGNPTAQELLAFAMENGALSVNKRPGKIS
jgi:plasmid replication initiation protein